MQCFWTKYIPILTGSKSKANHFGRGKYRKLEGPPSVNPPKCHPVELFLQLLPPVLLLVPRLVLWLHVEEWACPTRTESGTLRSRGHTSFSKTRYCEAAGVPEAEAEPFRRHHRTATACVRLGTASLQERWTVPILQSKKTEELQDKETCLRLRSSWAEIFHPDLSGLSLDSCYEGKWDSMSLSSFKEPRLVSVCVCVCLWETRAPGYQGWKPQVNPGCNFPRQLPKNASSLISITSLILERTTWLSLREEKRAGGLARMLSTACGTFSKRSEPLSWYGILWISKKSLPPTDLHCQMCLLSVIQHTDSTFNGHNFQYVAKSQFFNMQVPLWVLQNYRFLN